MSASPSRLPDVRERNPSTTTVFNLVMLLLRWRWALAGIIVGFGAWGFVGAKLNRAWSVEATIRPQSPTSPSTRLSGVAAQFGLTLPGAALGDPVRFYAELLQSREVLGQVVLAPYAVATHRGSPDSIRGTFLDLYRVPGVDSADRDWRGRERLKALMTITTDREAGFVRLKLATKWPDLSLQLGRAILAVTNAASISKQQAQAVAERTFVEARMKDAQGELDSAEMNLERFLTTNHQYQNSPLLTLQYGRLQRRVDLRQQVFVGLAQAYEQARIDEVRNTPVLMIVDGVDGSLRPTHRAGRDALLWMVVGAGLGVALVLALDGANRFRDEHPAQAQALIRQVRAAWPFS